MAGKWLAKEENVSSGDNSGEEEVEVTSAKGDCNPGSGSGNPELGNRNPDGKEDRREEELSHPIFKPKPNAHSMCAQESSLYTYRTENGDRITNVSI
jgi:hypothetical protein